MNKPAENDHTAEQESTSSKKPASTKEQDLSEAAERVYRRYGSDLPAFYRNAQRERELEKRG
jgi:hypothetical protein